MPGPFAANGAAYGSHERVEIGDFLEQVRMALITADLGSNPPDQPAHLVDAA